nr:hypothetical protein BaRGS_021682 [Batillaria attramentaria]
MKLLTDQRVVRDIDLQRYEERKQRTKAKLMKARLTEQEEVIRDKSRALSMLQVRVSYLEDENRHLQQRADSLAAQKQTLDKLVKDFQHNREREIGGINVIIVTKP